MLLLTPAAAIAASTQTFDPARISANVTLSGGNLIATGVTINSGRAFGKNGAAANGKYYWEIRAQFPTSDDNCGIGVGNTTSGYTGGLYLGGDNTTLAFYPDGILYYNNASAGLNGQDWHLSTQPVRLDLALDTQNNKFWWRGPSGLWFNQAIGSQNPATNTGGYAIPAAVYAAAMQPGVNAYNPGTATVQTAVFSQSSWAGAAPSGFGQWP